MDDELKQLKQENAELAARLREASVRDMLADQHGLDRGAVKLLSRYVMNQEDLTDGNLGEYVQAAAQLYRDAAAERVPRRRIVRLRGVNPQGAAIAGAGEGYVSPEEYVATPIDVRHSPRFRERVERSRQYWPTKVPARTFAAEARPFGFRSSSRTRSPAPAAAAAPSQPIQPSTADDAGSTNLQPVGVAGRK